MAAEIASEATRIRAGATALVTGASSGLGAQFVTKLAERGMDLVLVARRAERLQAIADTIQRNTGKVPIVLTADLAAPDSAAELHQRIVDQGVQVDLLINNAGMGAAGDVIATDPVRVAELLQLNCGSLTELSMRFGAEMVSRGRGTIVNIASLAAAVPTPHMAIYGASKSYVLNFTTALDTELRATGVRAIAVLPSATRTEFEANGGTIPGPDNLRADPSEVVEEILAQLERPKVKGVVIPGRGNALLAALLPRLPRRFSLRMLAAMMSA